MSKSHFENLPWIAYSSYTYTIWSVYHEMSVSHRLGTKSSMAELSTIFAYIFVAAESYEFCVVYIPTQVNNTGPDASA